MKGSQWIVLLPVVLTLSILVVFYPRLGTTPSDAGFWMIFVFGLSVGVALTRIVLWYRERRSP